jgi:hypothetical protein
LTGPGFFEGKYHQMRKLERARLLERQKFGGSGGELPVFGVVCGNGRKEER